MQQSTGLRQQPREAWGIWPLGVQCVVWGLGTDPSCILLTCIMDSRACLPLCFPCGAGVGIALTGHCSSLRSPFALILVGLLIYFFGGATRSMKKTSAPSTL